MGRMGRWAGAARVIADHIPISQVIFSTLYVYYVCLSILSMFIIYHHILSHPLSLIASKTPVAPRALGSICQFVKLSICNVKSKSQRVPALISIIIIPNYHPGIFAFGAGNATMKVRHCDCHFVIYSVTTSISN